MIAQPAWRRAGCGTWRAMTWAGSLGAAALTAHTVANLRAVRTPARDPATVIERVSIVVPARDEAARIRDSLTSLLDQTAVPDLEVLILDDGSTDGTADVVRDVIADDPRARLITGSAPPPDWLGKPHACRQLADAATGSVLVFVDADVRLAPHAVAATVGLLRGGGLDLVSPYPRQLADTAAERLVQPLLTWSWMTTLPVRLAERSSRPSLSAANGQLLAMDAAAYRRIGGHAAVRGAVLDDLALARALKRAGGRVAVADGSQVATCRMYQGWDELRDGYAKSLWAAFRSRPSATAVMAGLGLLYVVPPVAALCGSGVGMAGYAAAVTGRYLVAERTGGRSLPDSFGHPLSIGLLAWLTATSWRRHRRGELTWKGRRLPGDGR